MQPDLRLGTCAATVANRIGSTAVLEYRPTETIPPLGAMLPSPASLPTTLPADSSHTRGNPGFALEQTRNPERGGLSAGGEWIRTSSSAPDRTTVSKLWCGSDLFHDLQSADRYRYRT